MRRPALLAAPMCLLLAACATSKHVSGDRPLPAAVDSATPAIHHVAIGVRDLQASIDWYRDKLGFQPDRAFRMEDAKLSAQQLRLGDFRVELFQFDDSAPERRARSDVLADLRAGGLSHFALSVPDVRAFAQQLQTRGVHMVVPVTEYVRGVPVAFIADNEGNLIEIVGAESATGA